MRPNILFFAIFVAVYPLPSQSGCETEGGTAFLSQDAAQYIYQQIYDEIAVSVLNLEFVATATKYVASLRTPVKEINLDLVENPTSNPIQNLMFDLFDASGADKSIYMGYSNKQFLSYRVNPGKTFSMRDEDTGATINYEFDIRNGQAKTDSILTTTDDYDCTSRPWYVTGISDDNCPKDEKNHYSCSPAWSPPYVDILSGSLVISAVIGMPSYSGSTKLPEIAGGILVDGRALGDTLLGVIASDIFLNDLDFILTSSMSATSSDASDVAYLMSSDGTLLAVSDGSKTYSCATDTCSSPESILATKSSSERIAMSAKYLQDSMIMSDNTLLVTLSGTEFVLTVREFRELSLEWFIVTVTGVNIDKSCTLELQSVALKEAIHAVDTLTSKAVAAGQIVKNAIKDPGGALTNPSGPPYEQQAWGDINANSSLSMQNLLKCVCEIFPEIASIFIGYKDDAFIAHDFGDGFLNLNYQDSGGAGTRNYYYVNPDTGYVYKDLGAFRIRSYKATDRPWYREANAASEALFSKPYLWSDLKTIGVTYSVPFYDANGDLAGVVGVDVSLDYITRELKHFTSSGNVIFGTETEGNKAYSMLASSSQATTTFEDSIGEVRQTKANVADEVKDFFVYNAAQYMVDNNVNIDTTFTVGNFSCSVLNYDNNGLRWRFVEVTYLYDSGQTTSTSVTTTSTSTTGVMINGDVVPPAILILVGFIFAIIVIVAAVLVLVVYKLNTMLKAMQRRRKVQVPGGMEMTANPLQGKAAAGMGRGGGVKMNLPSELTDAHANASKRQSERSAEVEEV